MGTTISNENIYSASDAAKLFGITEGRVCQLCRWEKIGRKFAGGWLLTDNDLDQLEKLPGVRFSRNRGNSQK
jgi:hypothetical protein